MENLDYLTAVIVDDHPLARMAIRSVLKEQGLQIQQEFEDGSAAFSALQHTAPDVVVVDVDIPGITGVELVEKLRANRYTGVLVVVSAKNDRYYSRRCAQAGANAFISKKQGMEMLVSALAAAQNGYSYFPFFLEETSDTLTDAQRLASLSAQEMKVMSFMLAGHENAQIGELMHISGKTVSTYKTRLMEKLGCSTLIELLAFAQLNKLT
jgi:Response regulator containing a CheY-like receiver domain and an HTH DNA-binding domain